jgi:hypothetical protein
MSFIKRLTHKLFLMRLFYTQNRPAVKQINLNYILSIHRIPPLSIIPAFTCFAWGDQGRGQARQERCWQRIGLNATLLPALANPFHCDIIGPSLNKKGDTIMAKDKDKGKEKGNKPKLSIKDKKKKKMEKLQKKSAIM